MRIHREPVIGRDGRCALLDEWSFRIETEIVDVGVRTEDGWNARVEELLEPVRIEALVILTGAEGLTPELYAGMAWDDDGAIGFLGHVAPDAQCEKDIRVNAVSQPGTPEMDVGHRAGVAASEIIGESQILARVDIEASGDLGMLDEFDTVGLWTTRRRWRLIRRRRHFERHA